MLNRIAKWIGGTAPLTWDDVAPADLKLMRAQIQTKALELYAASAAYCRDGYPDAAQSEINAAGDLMSLSITLPLAILEARRRLETNQG